MPRWLDLARGESGGDAVADLLDELAEGKPSDVQGVVFSQIKLLNLYHNTVLQQARTSFELAVVAAAIGLVFFLGALAFLLTTALESAATASVISGALVEVISGINFFLYRKSTAQLALFHERLDRTQRFLLANSICDTLPAEDQPHCRAELAKVIASYGMKPAGGGNAGGRDRTAGCS